MTYRHKKREPQINGILLGVCTKNICLQDMFLFPKSTEDSDGIQEGIWKQFPHKHPARWIGSNRKQAEMLNPRGFSGKMEGNGRRESMTKRAITITNSNQKGGCGKTVTTGALANSLANMGFQTLFCDMDPQADGTELFINTLTDEQFIRYGLAKDEKQKVSYFAGRSVFEAIQEEDATPYIVNVKENLDLLPATDDLAVLSRYVLTTFTEKTNDGHIKTNANGQVKVSVEYARALRRTLSKVWESYDFIFIDTPPSLGEETINALAASDFVNVVFETSQFSYKAIRKFTETVMMTQKRINPELKLIGIIPTLISERRVESKAYLSLVDEEYPNLKYDTMIKRKAFFNRLPTMGMGDDPATRIMMEPYDLLAKEILKRIGVVTSGEGIPE